MSADPRMLYLRPGVDPREPEGKVWADALPDMAKFVKGVFAREKQRIHEATQRRLEDKYLHDDLPITLRRQAN